MSKLMLFTLNILMDVNYTYGGDYFAIYTNMESLWCIPEINMLYVNYISIF